MIVASVSVTNYKSFLNSLVIEFEPGFNVIVGTNNSGKSALLEAISLRFEDRPHRSIETVPFAGAAVPGNSRVRIEFSLPKKEFYALLNQFQPTFSILKDQSRTQGEEVERIQQALAAPEFVIAADYANQNLQRARIANLDTTGQAKQVAQFDFSGGTNAPKLVNPNVSFQEDRLAGYQLARHLSPRIYLFKAERLNVGQHNIGTQEILNPDASNLAQVLNLLQTRNPHRFNRLIELVRSIFPDIQQITAPPTPEAPTVARILLWNVDAETERDDLAIPLQESGTGIGQVLAILYVAITSDFPRPILIDEPQSFLHPSAVRRLLDILIEKFSQHQYLVTTHSPVVISATSPQSIVLLRKNGSESIAESLSTSDTDNLRVILAEVGVRLSDIFGADRILWVEGQTEEMCYQAIATDLLGRSLLGTTILGVLNVGDLEGRYAKSAFRIYRRLSESGGLLPPAVGFVFDREGRSDQDREDLVRESSGDVAFLPRRMYENYLVDPEAIVSMLESEYEPGDSSVTVEVVQSWLNEHMWESQYVSENEQSSEDASELWLREVHAARLLSGLVSDVSENRFQYDKVRHGLEITKWLIQNRPEALADIVSILDKVFQTESAGEVAS
ncbi:MAG: AAA family ATPase [Chloroflexi bacterium]|nr:AAA family ATPase [Chloroflexota bacterium]